MRFRVKIESATITETVVGDTLFTMSQDQAVSDGQLTYAREREQVYYRYSLASSIQFYGEGYTLLEALFNECEEVTTKIEVFCADEWQAHWQGVFTKFDCEIDKTSCTVSVKPRPDDAYKCLTEAWTEERNIYNAGDRVTTRATLGAYTLNGDYCLATDDGPTEPDPDGLCPTPPGWCIEDTIISGGPGDWTVQRTYHRETAEGTPTTPPPYGTGWTLLSGSTWWRCPELAEVGAVYKFGILFNEALEYVIGLTDCGLTVRSHFFGLNATHAAPPANDAYTFADDFCQFVTIHQKSDIKRPYSTQEAQERVYVMPIRQLLDDLRTAFNVWWDIRDGDLILEHISYFTSSAGPDHTAEVMDLEYSYDVDIPKVERFAYMDAECSTDFRAFPITYDCGDGEKDYRLNLFSMDVKFISDPLNAAVIQDAGFVLISNFEKSAGVYAINNLNAPFAWPELHDKLHRHWRKFSAGTLNGLGVTFESVEPLRKQTPYDVADCCGSTFDPTEYITTALGEGRVQEATRNLHADSLTITLLYE